MRNIIVFEVRVNGKPLLFALDTGASNTAISPDVAKELNLKIMGSGKAQGISGVLQTAITRIDSLVIGDIELRDLACVVVDLSQINKLIGGGVSGVLGFDVLSKFRITIDYMERKLIFEKYKEEDIFEIKNATYINYKYKIKVSIPNKNWEFITKTPLPQMIIILRRVDKNGEVIIDHAEIHKLTLESLIPSIKSILEMQVNNFKLHSINWVLFKGRKSLYMEYFGDEKGMKRIFKHYFLKIGDNLYSIRFSSPIDKSNELTEDFNKIIESIHFV